jgi:hypothetical protein
MATVSKWALFKAGIVAIVTTAVALILWATGRRRGAADEAYTKDIERINEAETGGDGGFLRDDILKRSKK